MKKWHTKKIEEIFRELKTSEKGLSEKEAKERLIKFGFNELITKKKISPFMIFLRQFKSFLILILLIAVLISATIGKITDALLILLILILNAILGFSQEYKAEKAMEALKKLATPKAMVIRDGRQIEVPARELVPGDLILLEEGVKIPADARLIEAVSLKVDESALTGESIPITKDIRTLKDVELAERKNMIFLGTTVTYGKGKAIVVDTGMQTEMGNIAKLIQVE
jgi:Ca2+-transporting ATPase